MISIDSITQIIINKGKGVIICKFIVTDIID